MLDVLDLAPVVRLTNDLKDASKLLSKNEARFIVDAYYIVQERRIAAAAQVRALTASDEPHQVLVWMFAQMEVLEKQIKRALDAWTDSQPVGVWLKEITGIGPVLAAGLLAHIDIEKAPTAGHIWRFAGLDPTSKWIGKAGAKQVINTVRPDKKGPLTASMVIEAASLAGRNHESLAKMAEKHGDGEITPAVLEAVLAKRPWNADLKVLCWKCGESFVKFQNHPQDVYGKLFVQRKRQEQEKNDRGEFAEIAKAALEAKSYSKSTEAYKAYSQGKLPPAHIHARAKRWSVKIFLSHLHAELFRQHYGVEPPAPYPVAILGHAHMIQRL